MIKAIRRLFEKDKLTDGLDMKALMICNTLICIFAGVMCILNIITADIRVAVVNGIMAAWFFIHMLIYTMQKNKVQILVAMMLGAYLVMMNYLYHQSY